MNYGFGHLAATGRKPVPRGIARSGPAVLSYGFRPFFLSAGGFALLAMVLWIGALTLGWEVGGNYGALNWHAHEMLFGYASAALAGFMLTAIPNWTGRLPVSGMPLLALVALWGTGRLLMLFPAAGIAVSMVIDAAFLPLLAAVAAREIIAGKNWKNLKILAGLVALSLVNIVFHWSVAALGSGSDVTRVAVAVYVMLIVVVGGRIVPSFTRNWLVKAGSAVVPAPFSRFDKVAIGALLVALLVWSFVPEGYVTALLAAIAAGLHAARLARWHGWRTVDEPLLLALHIGYVFVPLGMLAVGMAAMGWLSAPSALHVLTVGAIGNMTLAVMTRTSLGHTGRALAASPMTSFAYLAMALAAAIRPFAELIPSEYHLILAVSGACWMAAFALFLIEYGPMLGRARTRTAA